MESVWYVLKVLPGKERSLNEEFNRQIGIGHINNIVRFVCPTEKEFVLVKKKRILRERVLYSGYLYFETPKLLNEDDLKEISMLPNVMSMMGNKSPLLMSKTDIRKIIVDDRLDEHQESKKLYFSVGENITVTEGPFNSFNGVISDIKGDKVEVEIKIFGRNNLVSLNSNQIQKFNG
jgi:transcriptional antiterminator NusG